MELFHNCIVQYVSSHKSQVTTKHLNIANVTEELNSEFFILMNLKWNSDMAGGSFNDNAVVYYNIRL